MLQGFSGHLISEQYLEHYLAGSNAPLDRDACTGMLREWRATQRTLGPSSSLRAMLEAGAGPLVRALGFETVDELAPSVTSTVATLRGAPVPVVLVVSAWGGPLDPLWRLGVGHAMRRMANWCLFFNGTHIRLVHAERVFSRRFVEFELDSAVDDERSAAALRLLLGVDAFSRAIPGTVSRVESFIQASDRHASAVCRSLRHGVLEASEHLLGAFLDRSGTPPVDDAFNQALTVVYRMLFLFFAEARALVPVWHPVYRESYSLETLRDAAVQRSAAGLWDSLRAVSRLAHAGCRAGDLRVAPFNGRLFAPSRTLLAERHDLDDEAARRSLVALSTRPAPDGEGRESIAYRDLGVEQLGAVYETLLDYSPEVRRAPRQGRTVGKVRVSLRPGSGIRKSTGSFYTPQSIAGYVIRQTLAPLVRDALPEQILSLRVLDPSMGSGAFLVGACTYLADAYEAALLRGGRCHSTDIGPRERATIRRTVAERCLYGVDLNPMAVQLARLSIWLATLAADRPLSFLDHHLQSGDSLLGTWLSCLRTRPAGKRRQERSELPLFDAVEIGEVLSDALPVRFSLALDPNDTPQQVRAKERSLASLMGRGSALSKWRRVADLWCAPWFSADLHGAASAFGALSDAILTGRSSLPQSITERLLSETEAVAAKKRFFHWELEFPEVFFDERGQRRLDAGFDAVIGNPPWDMVRADARNGDNPQPGPDAGQLVRFSRNAGVYQAQSDGHANRYQLFLERSLALTRSGGRLGLVLPSGLASDQGSAPLRRMLFSRSAVDSVVGFDNSKAIFPIHRSMRFLLVSATAGARTKEICCRLGEVDPSILEGADEGNDGRAGSWFSVRLTPSLLERLSGDALTIPHLRTRLDLTIVERAASLFPSLGTDAGWNATFGRELNATEHRQHFSESRHGLPVVEGKMLEPFRVRTGEARFRVSERKATQLLRDRHLRSRLAYRDVASATNRVTLIAAMLPPRCVSTHTVFCLKSPMRWRAQLFLCGLFNSLVVNYLVRLRVTTHVTATIVERLPLPREDQAGPAFLEISGLTRLLRRTDDRALLARLNARVAKLYQLGDEEFAYILATFPLVPKADRDAAMRAFADL